MEFLNALFTAAFDNNIVFVQMVGMVSVIVLALRPQDSVRFGLALWAASAVSGIIGWPIYYLLLQPWGLDYLAPMAYLLVSATCVFFVGAVATANTPSWPSTPARSPCRSPMPLPAASSRSAQAPPSARVWVRLSPSCSLPACATGSTSPRFPQRCAACPSRL